MPRRPRLVTSGVPLHIIQRGNNRQRCFCDDSDYLAYLSLLEHATRRAGCPVHAYVLMSNHVHVLATPNDALSAARMMKAVGERYVRYFNKKYERTGTLWDGRYRSGVVDEESYLMVCYRYIELNPVRANIVNDPALYRWSSFRVNAWGAHSPIISPHGLYDALGSDPFGRQNAYRELIAEVVDEEHITALRDATNHNYACGPVKFQRDVTRATGQAAGRTRNLV